ncbi:putative L-asparaginase, partial [Toxoplasma gondii p89]
ERLHRGATERLDGIGHPRRTDGVAEQSQWREQRAGCSRGAGRPIKELRSGREARDVCPVPVAGRKRREARLSEPRSMHTLPAPAERTRRGV